MTEEQAFWCLTVLCDRLIPGYYSTTMYGTLLDQRVFEGLVERTMPILWEHFTKCDIQLSVISLPWFLSMYINSMPLIFSFRIVDCFFLEGPKVLFQVGLAILRINGEELLDCQDDGMFIQILKAFFNRLHESAHPDSKNEKIRAVTVFQELMVVAFREFSTITFQTIEDERKKHKDIVLSSIESFAKRTQLRNLHKTGRLSPEDLSNVYDRFHNVLSSRRLGFGPPQSSMDLGGFRVFLAGIAKWADTPHPFTQRLFVRWDSTFRGSLTLQDVVSGISSLVQRDLMSTIEYFFTLFDSDGDGILNREEVLALSEALLFVIRGSDEDLFLAAVSSFLRRCYEYADAEEKKESLIDHESAGNSNGGDRQISVTLPTFRMVVLADEPLERFFDNGFAETINLAPTAEKPKDRAGLRGLFDGLMQDGMKVAGDVRRRMDEGTGQDDEEDEDASHVLKGPEAESVVESNPQSSRVQDVDDMLSKGEVEFER